MFERLQAGCPLWAWSLQWGTSHGPGLPSVSEDDVITERRRQVAVLTGQRSGRRNNYNGQQS